jgi:hypothetical protein
MPAAADPATPEIAQEGASDAERVAEMLSAAREADWSTVGLSDRVGNISVAVISSGIEDVTTDNRRRRYEGLLVVRISIANHSDKLRVHFSGWGAGGSASHVVGAEDDVGNVYTAYSVLDDKADGQALEQEINPGYVLTDVLIFERPVDAAKFLKIRLPADALGGDGFIRLRVPLSMAAKRSVEQELRKAKRQSTGRAATPDAEKAAAAKVSQAKALRTKGKDDLAARYLREVVDQYPGTEAAAEAAELLK